MTTLEHILSSTSFEDVAFSSSDIYTKIEVRKFEWKLPNTDLVNTNRLLMNVISEFSAPSLAVRFKPLISISYFNDIRSNDGYFAENKKSSFLIDSAIEYKDEEWTNFGLSLIRQGMLYHEIKQSETKPDKSVIVFESMIPKIMKSAFELNLEIYSPQVGLASL